MCLPSELRFLSEDVATGELQWCHLQLLRIETENVQRIMDGEELQEL
jgi:hypothetical protein